MSFERPVGKSVTFFYPDGKSDGLIVLELMNWTGIGLRIPRSKFPEARKLERSNSTGIYFLLGDPNAENLEVYIGKSENVYARLSHHLQDNEKDFWEEAVVFVCKDEGLNAGHIAWLESALVTIVKQRKDIVCRNKTTPKSPKLSAATVCYSEEFLYHLLFVMTALGKGFEKRVSEDPVLISELGQHRFYLRSSKGKLAEGYLSSSGFTVLSNATILTGKKSSAREKIQSDLKRKIADGEVILNTADRNATLMETTEFSSPSYAASFIKQASVNGRDEWKTENGDSINDVERGVISSVEADLFSSET